MIRSSEYFVYDNINSQDYGIMNVNLSSGMLEEPFLSTREIKEIISPGRDKPYHQRINRQPLQFDLSFAFMDTWNDDLIREVARWLNQDYYRPLYFSEDPNKIYYSMPVDDITLTHNGLKQGFITLKMRCDSPYAYSPEYLSEVYDFSTNPAEGTQITFTNNGDVACQPEMSIEKVNAGDISIVNLSDDGKEFKFTELVNGEELYINNESEFIQSSLEIDGIYRYDNFSGDFLSLARGVSNLLITGQFKLQFKYRFKLT